MPERDLTLQENERWQELRDDAGRLYARVEPTRWLLEIRRRDHSLALFDLRDYLDLANYLENPLDIE